MGFGEVVHCILAEATQAPGMLLGVCNGLLGAVGASGNAVFGAGAVRDRGYLERIGITPTRLANATHLVWGTGGSMVPEGSLEAMSEGDGCTAQAVGRMDRLTLK